MITNAMKELTERINDVKGKILYENSLKVPDKKIMHSWFKFFDQNLKGIEGHDVKLTLYSAFKIMADKGVLMPPFNLPPYHEAQKIKGAADLVKFDRKYDGNWYRKQVEEYKENLNKPKQRPKTAPAGKRETKTVVTNKKVVEEGPERKTTISTTLEVVTNEPESSEMTVTQAKPMLRRSKTGLDIAANQQLKKERIAKIKFLEAEIIKAGKQLSPEKQDMVDAWLKALNDKLKRETELEDRILALTALKLSLGAKKLLPPFDNVPARGKLNVREFMTKIDLEEMQEKVMLAVPVVKKKVVDEGEKITKDGKEAPSRRPITAKEAPVKPQMRRSKTGINITAGQVLKRERIAKIKGLEAEIQKMSKLFKPDKQDMIEAWLKALNDKLKQETQLEDRILALTALLTSLNARKLLPPFDEVPARGKLNVREFMSRLNLQELEAQAMLAAPKKKKKPTVDPKTPLQATKTEISNPLVKNDAIQAVVANAGKAMNAICDENLEVLEEIPPIMEQVTHAVSNSPHRSTKPLVHEFTPLVLYEPPMKVHTQRLYDSAEFEDFDLEKLDEPNLDESIYDEDEETDFLVPVVGYREDVSPFERRKTSEDAAQGIEYDPGTFLADAPEFDFIPLEVKAYIWRLVRTELIHWPAFLQEIGDQLFLLLPKKLPVEEAELIEFSPNK